MREILHIDLSEATVPWLDGHLARYGGLASSIPRTPSAAIRWFLRDAFSAEVEHVKVHDLGIVLEVEGSLDAVVIERLLAARILHAEKVFTLSSVEPKLDYYGENEVRCWLEILFGLEKNKHD